MRAIRLASQTHSESERQTKVHFGKKVKLQMLLKKAPLLKALLGDTLNGTLSLAVSS